MADAPRKSRNKSHRHEGHDGRSRSRGEPHSRDISSFSNISLENYDTRDQSITMQQTLEAILSRLDKLERGTQNELANDIGGIGVYTRSHTPIIQQHVDDISSHESTPPAGLLKTNLNDQPLDSMLSSKVHLPQTTASDTSAPSQSTSGITESARILAEAIKTLNNSRMQDYFISNFDPSINDIEVWCEEVERARSVNNWNDTECLSRVSGCLKGDARSWLNEWVTSDRSWSNFCREFKPLCSRKLDYANILFDAMQSNSDKFTGYAEYARKTLLRLKIVKGLSDELRVLIVLHGITDPHVRAAAVNASLTCDDLIPFLSIYVKPAHNKQGPCNLTDKRRLPHINLKTKCYSCGKMGHKSSQCSKKSKNSSVSQQITNNNNMTCSFCKKSGHNESSCFAKNRSGPRNTHNVNLCKERSTLASRDNDLTTAVIQGIPMDVLIDSGALNISLISSNVLKYLSCERKPIHCILKGISDTVINSESFVTLTIEFDEISIEADFVVVPGSCMTVPIIVGTDILNRDGIMYVRSKNKQYLTRSIETPIMAVSTNLATGIDTPLQGYELDSLMLVINQFSDYLISGTASTTVNTGKMHIELRENKPVAYRPYRLSHSEKLKVREIVGDLKEKGIIRDSNSEYASPILLVKKKDGSDRMCVDYRALNRLTVRERYPLPLIDDCIDRLGSFEYFTSLDMATGFHQIPIDEQSIHKTAFITPEGHYEYVRMPFGLTNSPIVYQRIINNTLSKHIENGHVLVYVDDVLIMSNTVHDGIQLLKDVLHTLTKAGFSIKLQKCSFLSTEIEYLGRIISRGQVRPSPHKVEALVKSLPPSNVRQVRQFLGLAGYFRKYIQNYASKTACISRLIKKNEDFQWGPEQEKVRRDIITDLTSSPVLSIFDPNLLTEVHTDASSIGYGGVLMQKGTDGRKHVVAYFSKTTQGAESRYHSYELETLAVVRALQHFRHYLVGLEFKIFTDCNALKATEKKKDLLPRVARWWIYLQDFNFNIEYRKGNLMSHVDYLSRNPISAEVYQISKPRNWAQIAQSADAETCFLIQKLQDGELDSQRYVYKNDLLYYRYSPVGEEPRLLCFIPRGHRLSLLRIFHDEHEHICAEKVVDLILKHFWFPCLRQFVSKYIKHCLVCISYKRIPRAPYQPISSWEKPSNPFETLHIDTLGPLPESDGYKFVLLTIDPFTKYCLLYPIYKQDVLELKRTFTNTISLFGVPKLLIVDRGRMFESTEFSSLLSDLGCDIHYITPEMHNANGQVERYVRTVLNMIRIEVNHKKSSWSNQLWKLQLVLNITKQKTTKTSALKLLIGIDGATPIIRSLVRDISIDMLQNREAWRELCRTRASELLNHNQKSQDAYVNRHRKPPRSYKVEDLVFVIKYSQSKGKLDPGMRGPYRVVKVLPSGRYLLKLLSGSYGKTTQAAAEYMIPWYGEWCPDTCAAFFDDYEDSEYGTTEEFPSLQPYNYIDEQGSDPDAPVCDQTVEY